MAQPYVGEIRMFAGNFAPLGWLMCDGQLASIAENETLFNLIGTTYGGDGQSTFAMPDMRGRVPIHASASLTLGQLGGEESVTLSAAQMPAHTHPFLSSTDLGGQSTPSGAVPAASNQVKPYTALAAGANMAPQVLLASGGSQPHSNFQPYLCVNFIISQFGIFPSQT
ncbi:MAG: tail fiber protein [Verrucomicrobiota bacterium]